MNITEEQALQIRELRRLGTGYKTIAELTDLTRDQVRYYCLSNGIGGYRIVYQANLKDRIADGRACAYCGGPLMRPKTGRPRRFCSEACRRKYWKTRQDKRKKSADHIYVMECPYCHRIFEVYGNTHRKYCCHEHYVLARFGHDRRVDASSREDGAFFMPEGKENDEISGIENAAGITAETCSV